MNLREVEKVVASIQSQLFKNSNSYAIGMLKSHFRGSGIQFKEHQVYVAGDDVRFIDWKLSAKTGKPYIKTFEEERNVQIVVVIDVTRSMFTGYKGKSKLQAAFELTCLLYLLAKETGDTVQVVLWDQEVTILPKKNGKEGIVTFVANMEKKKLIKSNGKINIEYQMNETVSEKKKLGILKSFLARNREVIVLSDFSSFMDLKELNKVLYKKNIHCFKIISPLDESNVLPYSVYAYNSNDLLQNKSFVSQKSGFVDRRKEKREKGRVKTLKVQERYLENFIKEML